MKFLISILLVIFGWSASGLAQVSIAFVGHRGGSSLGPENTLAVLKKGMESGMDFLEIDIHQTADSVLVLSHDETLNRCTNGTGRIDAHTLAEIQQLDAGSWFSEEFAGEKIPTLEQALALLDGRCGLWIEVKGNAKEYPGLERRLVALIQAHHAQSWVQVISFDTEALQRIHLLDSTIHLQKLLVSNFAAVPFYMDKRLRFGSIKQIDFVDSYGFYAKFVHRHIVRKIHRWGKKANAWTINKPKQMQHLQRIGIDGLTSDKPILLIQTIAR